MIEPHELMIDNWLQLKGRFVKICGIFDNCAYFIGEKQTPVSYDLKDFAPISLTPEILDKAGFVDDGNFDNHSIDYWRNGCIHLQFPNYEGEGWECGYVWRDNAIEEKGYNKQYEVKVKYLHQLQNLYKCLTGQELKIEL